VQALRERGVDVPGAVAVTGFDDVPLARYLALTTVRVHLVDLGARAVARLAERLGGGAHDETTERVTPELVVRATSQHTETR
jgi:LacI family transcriptional regulator